LISHYFHLTYLYRRLFRLTIPAPHNAQSIVLRHGTHIGPARITDCANNGPAHLAICVLVELADERWVRAEAERGSGRVLDVDAVALDGFGPGASAGPVRTSAVVSADELDLDALWSREGEDGEAEQRDEAERVHGCGIYRTWVWFGVYTNLFRGVVVLGIGWDG